jgi:Trp operon repressor
MSTRYSPEYKLTDEEMRWIGERATILQELVRAVCAQRLAPPDR